MGVQISAKRGTVGVEVDTLKASRREEQKAARSRHQRRQGECNREGVSSAD